MVPFHSESSTPRGVMLVLGASSREEGRGLACCGQAPTGRPAGGSGLRHRAYELARAPSYLQGGPQRPQQHVRNMRASGRELLPQTRVPCPNRHGHRHARCGSTSQQLQLRSVPCVRRSTGHRPPAAGMCCEPGALKTGMHSGGVELGLEPAQHGPSCVGRCSPPRGSVRAESASVAQQRPLAFLSSLAFSSLPASLASAARR